MKQKLLRKTNINRSVGNILYVPADRKNNT